MKRNTTAGAGSANKNKSDGFTLVDMLAVLAVVAFLVFVPAPAGAEWRTGETVCVSNVKQFTMALHLYGGGSKDKATSGKRFVRQAIRAHRWRAAYALPRKRISLLRNRTEIQLDRFPESHRKLSDMCGRCPAVQVHSPYPIQTQLSWLNR